MTNADADAFWRYLSSDYFTWISCDSANARRIGRRIITMGWWAVHQKKEGRHIIVLSKDVDLEKDLKAKLPGIVFELT